MALLRRLRDRRITNAVRYLLDDWLPPAVREWRPLNAALARAFHGAGFDLDFKAKAFTMSEDELAGAYAALDGGGARYRDSDTTPAQADALVAAARGSVLEVGCGNGMVAERLAAAGHPLTVTDVTTSSLDTVAARVPSARRVQAGLPALPFADAEFDTVVCAHTLEHVPDLFAAAAALRRVARRRLLVVVPRQRYYRYTIDYHLHFFPSAAPLAHLLGGTARLVDGDWLITAERG